MDEAREFTNLIFVTLALYPVLKSFTRNSDGPFNAKPFLYS